MSEVQSVPSQAEFRARASEAERNYHAACADGDLEAITEAAFDYTEALYYVVDAGLESMAPFTKLVRIMDSAPAWWHEWHTHSVLWRYKWVVQAAQKDPRIPLATIEELLAGMERRYLQHGASLRPVLKCRAESLLMGCGSDSADPVFEQWQSLERSELCDCVDCEPQALLTWHVLTGKHSEASSLMRSAMERHGEISCFDQPQDFYAIGVEPLMLTEDVETASWVQRMGHRLDVRQPTRHNFLRHGHVLARSGAGDAALAMLSLAADHADRNPLEEAENLARAAGILGCVDGDTVGEFWPGFVGTAGVVSESLAERGLEIAAAFDERNGNAVVSGRIQEMISASELVALPNVRVLSPAKMSAVLAAREADPGEQAELGDTGDHHGALSSGQVSARVREAVSFSRVGYSVVDAETTLADFRADLDKHDSVLTSLTILGAWSRFVEEDDRGATEADTAAGARLTCLLYRLSAEVQPHVDLPALDRVADTAERLHLGAVSRFVQVSRLVDSAMSQDPPRFDDAALASLLEAAQDSTFVGDIELAPIALGPVYGLVSQGPDGEARTALDGALVEALSTTGRGKWSLAAAHRDHPVASFQQRFEDASPLLAGTVYSDDVAFAYCLDSFASAWLVEDMDAVRLWMGRAFELVGAVSSVRLLDWAFGLAVRFDSAIGERRETTASFLVAVARQIAVVKPRILIVFIGGLARVLIAVDRYLDLLELAELALAEVRDVGDGERELKIDAYGAAALSCRALREVDTAIRYAELACELDSEDPRLWLLYSWKFRDEDDSLGQAKALRRAAGLFWADEAVVHACSCVGQLVDAVHEADGFDAADAVIDEWTAQLESLAPGLDAREAAIGRCLLLVARSSLAFDDDRYDASLVAARALLAEAEGIDLVPEITRGYWFICRSLWLADRTDEAVATLVELFGRFPESPQDEDFDSCVSLYMRYLMSEGRTREAEELTARYGR